jgi:hypothetical protein
MCAGSFGLGPGAEPRPVAAASSAGGLLQGRIMLPPDASLPESPAGADLHMLVYAMHIPIAVVIHFQNV